MSQKKPFVLVNNDVRRRVADYALHQAPEGWAVVFQEKTRSLDQNALLWPLLECFAQQLEWPVNGVMCKLSKEEWKTVLTAGVKKENMRMAAGIDGGVVMLGSSTSIMPKREFSELIEFIMFVAAARGVDLERKY